jgi:predicted membrane-bound spermidine synthase
VTSAAASRRELAFVGALFVLSGAAALVYQVAWQRILVLHSGVGIYSVAIIVASFMAGLGLGSHWGGVLSARVGPLRALRLFALLELGIGAFALVSPWLYYDVLYLRGAWIYDSLLRSALAHLAALVVPTTLMGMSLPFLVRAMVADVSSAGRVVGLLYGVNVVGAAAGAFATPWLLLRHLGVPGAVYVGVALNFATGLGALALTGRVRESAQAEAPGPAPRLAGARPLVTWILLYAASGFCALSLEVLWFRLVDVVVKSTAFTFGTVLAFYLAGLAAGSLLGVRLVVRLRDPLRAFLLCQCLLLGYALLVPVLLVALPESTPGLSWFLSYWTERQGFRLGGEWNLATLLRLYVGVPLLSYGPPTFLMGLSFAVLQRAVHDDPRTSGFKVGVLQAANIAGCVAGSLLCGLVGLRFLGTPGTLRALAVFGVAFALLGVRRYGARSAFGAAALVLTALSLAVPGADRLWLRLHGLRTPPAYFAEDAAGLVALTPEADAPGTWRMSVNGRSISTLPFGGVHSHLGAVPAAMHPDPRRIAVIGLGSGDTAWAAGLRPGTETIRVYEICAPQLLLLQRLAADAPPARLRRFLRDRRYEFRFEDGRNALERSQERWDVIETDALLPYSAGSGNVYSREFFEGCARRLNPGGLMCTWSPTPRVHATFKAAFPHVLSLSDGLLLVGSNQPIAIDPGAWRERLLEPRAFSYLGEQLFHEVWARLQTATPWQPREAAGLDLDLFPRDEFRTP